MDDIHCLLEARNKDADFLYSVLGDVQLHSLLNLYDEINTSSYRPFRFPPSDACLRLKDALAALKVLEVTAEPDLADVEELRDLLTQHHMKALVQVRELTGQVGTTLSILAPSLIVLVLEHHKRMSLQKKSIIEVMRYCRLHN